MKGELRTVKVILFVYYIILLSNQYFTSFYPYITIDLLDYFELKENVIGK